MPSGTRTSGAGRHECGVGNGLGSQDGLRLDRRLDHGLDLADLLDLTDVHGGLQVVFRGRSQEIRGERSLSSTEAYPAPPKATPVTWPHASGRSQRPGEELPWPT